VSAKISEQAFEAAIECELLQNGPDACGTDAADIAEIGEQPPAPWGDTPPGGYRKRAPEVYDRTLCLLPRDVVDFVSRRSRRSGRGSSSTTVRR